MGYKQLLVKLLPVCLRRVRVMPKEGSPDNNSQGAAKAAKEHHMPERWFAKQAFRPGCVHTSPDAAQCIMQRPARSIEKLILLCCQPLYKKRKQEGFFEVFSFNSRYCIAKGRHHTGGYHSRTDGFFYWHVYSLCSFTQWRRHPLPGFFIFAQGVAFDLTVHQRA